MIQGPHNLNVLTIAKLMGTFDRGRNDEVPENHFITSRNVMFQPTGVKTRDGSVISFTPGLNIVRFFFRRSETLGNTLLYLTDDGRLYGVKNSIVTLLLTNPLMLDFSITDDATRIFITPHDRNHGIVGEKIYWWDGVLFGQIGAPAPIALSPMTVTETGAGISEIQTVSIVNATGGGFKLRTQQGATVTLPYNVTRAQMESALMGDNERQTISISGATGGAWHATWQSNTTVIPWDASMALLISLFDELFSPFGGSYGVDWFLDTAGGASLDGGPYTIVFIGSLAKQDVPFIIVDGSTLTGPNPQVAVTETLQGRTIFGAGNVVVTGDNPNFTVSWTNFWANKAIDQLIPEEVNLTGLNPTVLVVTVQDGHTPGKIEAGTRKFAVVFETTYGFQTQPGPKIGGLFTPTTYTAPGGYQALISNIPVGPTGTAKRVIIATKINEEEYFYVPNGVINNNTSTTLIVDYFESELIESADFLFDIAESIPAALGLCQYNGRMVAWGFPYPDDSLLRISRAGQFESFDQVEGLVLVNKADRFGIKACGVLRSILYVIKTQGAHAVQDNGEEPAFWEPSIVIDNGVGTVINGISSIPNVTAGSTKDRWLIADVSGLLLFDGIFRRPELTWKIQDIWLRVNKQYLNTIQVWDDPVHQWIFINVPLDSATHPTAVLYADYSLGLDAENIKWTIWYFPTDPVSISVFDLAGNGIPIFRYGGGGATSIFRLCDSIHTDNGETIEGCIRTWLMAEENPGDVNLFAGTRMRIVGNGELDITLYAEDEVPIELPPLIIINPRAGKEYTRMFNFLNERMSMEICMNGPDEWFDLYKILVFCRRYSAFRPG